MIRYNLLRPFPGAFGDFPYTPSIWKGEFLHMELRYRASLISRGLLGSTPSGRHMRGRGWTLASAIVDHGAKLPFYTWDYISASTHPSCDVGAWFGSSKGVTFAPLNCKPSTVPADSGSINSPRRTPLM